MYFPTFIRTNLNRTYYTTYSNYYSKERKEKKRKNWILQSHFKNKWKWNNNKEKKKEKNFSNKKYSWIHCNRIHCNRFAHPNYNTSPMLVLFRRNTTKPIATQTRNPNSRDHSPFIDTHLLSFPKKGNGTRYCSSHEWKKGERRKGRGRRKVEESWYYSQRRLACIAKIEMENSRKLA